MLAQPFSRAAAPRPAWRRTLSLPLGTFLTAAFALPVEVLIASAVIPALTGGVLGTIPTLFASLAERLHRLSLAPSPSSASLMLFVGNAAGSSLGGYCVGGSSESYALILGGAVVAGAAVAAAAFVLLVLLPLRAGEAVFQQ